MLKDPKTYNILILEDNEGDFVLFQDYFDETLLNADVLHARDFFSARQLIQNHSKPFDIVFLDLTLPDLSGKALVEALVSLNPKCPIVVLTGFTDANFALTSLALGISDYLLKDDLNATILYKSLIYNIERYKSIQLLKASQKLYSDIFHLSPQPMWLRDPVTKKILDVNAAAILKYGYSYDEFLHLTEIEITVPLSTSDDHSPTIVDNINPEYSFSNHTLHKTKNGQQLNVDVRSSSIEFEGRAAEIVLAHDITQRIKQLKAIQIQNKKLREIAWIQSHVVRAPLARLMGLIEVFEYNRENAEELDKIFLYIMDSAKELDAIIKEIADKSQAVLPEPPEISS